MSEIIIKKPVHILNRNVKFDLKKFFKDISSMAISTGVAVATSDPIAIGKSVASIGSGIAKNISLENLEPEELAWVLIVQSLIDALGVQLGNFQDLLLESSSTINVDAIAEQITDKINELKITLTDEFFRNPQQLQFLDDLQPILQEWLQQLGLNGSQAKAFYYQLKLQFAMSLHNEWGSNGLKYAPIIEHLDTPFSAANTAQRKALEYRLWLQQEVNKRMFDEAFGLQDIYIPLRAYHCQPKDKEHKVEADSELDHIRTEIDINKKVVMLHDEIMMWLSNNEPQDNIRVISGGPGSGKSSFAKILASDLATDSDIPILFIPLHHFHLNSYLLDAINQFVSNQPILKETILTQEQNLLLIFDGLDELAMQNSSSMDAASNFIDELTNALRVRESMHWRAIVTGRELSIQSQQHKLKKLKTIYHLLPYYVSEIIREDFDDTSNLLENDQRNDWWQKFGDLKNENYDGLPLELATVHLEPITSEPLLNYLVSLSYLRQDIEFTEETNLNQIYADLLDSVHERKYSQSGTHSSVNDMDKQKFIRILQEIALTVWHQNGRTATVAQITEQCRKSGIDSYFNVFTQDAKSGVIRLLMAFYFKKFEGGNDDETFEFTHKSFGEYLTARRIVLELDLMLDEVKRGKERIGSGWTLEVAFEKWIRICGQQGIDGYLRTFLEGEIQILADKPNGIERINAYQKLLIELIQLAVKVKSPIKKLMLDSFDDDLEYSRNSEIALFELHSLCAFQTNIIIEEVNYINKSLFSDWLNRVDYWRDAKLNHLNLEGCRLSNSFVGCDFSSTNLNRCDFIMSSIYDSNFTNVRMDETTILLTSFINSNFTNVNLHTVRLSEDYFGTTNFGGCFFKNANFEGKSLRRLDFTGSNLMNTNFKNATFDRINFSHANLQNANFEGTNHEDAIFTGANLKGTILEDLYPSSAEATEGNQ